MHAFQRILFASLGTGDETPALAEALNLARACGARLDALLLCPRFPPELAAYRQRFETALVEQLQSRIGAARRATGIDLPVSIGLESGGRPALAIIQHVLREGHGLVIKQAEAGDDGAGLRAVDMELLRKCPAAVWLSRPGAGPQGARRTAVAVDALETEPAARGLSLRLLEVAHGLAASRGGALDVLSCWDYEYEQYLRDNPWIKVPEQELAAAVARARDTHRAALDALLGEAGVGQGVEVHAVRGRPDAVIPALVAERGVDLLVMGTVGRTGIHGLLIGNTAENILRRVHCSLLALKPEGFASPVKP
jgi:universal stress protein E